MPPYEPTTSKEHFAFQRMKEAAELLEAADDARRKNEETTRIANDRFYNSLALFSGGTVALSVTYLGYLKTLSKPIQHAHWLMGSWIALIVCIACSTFWSFFYGYYAHYFLAQQYADAIKRKHETNAKEIDNFNIANLQTKAELDAYKNPRVALAAESAGYAKSAGRWASFYSFAWRSLGWVARLGFLAGLTLLLLFAIKNM
jgi:hypothetical protein